MGEKREIRYSLLVISSEDKFFSFFSRAMDSRRYETVDVIKSAAQARRELLTRTYDVVVINMPLSDETGMELSVDISEKYNSGVILVTSEDKKWDTGNYVSDYGVMVLSKPISGQALSQSVRTLCGIQRKFRHEQKRAITLEDKMKEIRIVNKAKWILIDKEGMSEENAHRRIEKAAMDRCVSKGQIAREIIDSH